MILNPVVLPISVRTRLFFHRFPLFCNYPLAGGQMDQKLFVSNRLETPIAFFSPRFTSLQMCWVFRHRNIKFTVFTIFGAMGAPSCVSLDIVGRKLQFTILTFSSFVELVFMLFQEVDVIHFSAFVTFLDIAPAVSEVGGHLGFREYLQAVVAFLCGFVASHLGLKYISNVDNVLQQELDYIRQISQ